MDRISLFKAAFVICFSALIGELLGLIALHLAEGTDDGIALHKQVGVTRILEEATADDLEAFFGTSRPPGRFETTNCVFEAVESLDLLQK